ncbi:MAG: hypothetical protein AAB701_01465 [Patescibacteria group bacterium]
MPILINISIPIVVIINIGYGIMRWRRHNEHAYFWGAIVGLIVISLSVLGVVLFLALISRH